MWGEDCYEGKSVLSPSSASKFCLAFTDLVINWVKSIPEEIIPNILIRLPIKSLIKFTSVCKSWRSTIKDPSFIRTHLTRTHNFNDQNATHLLLLHTVSSEGTFNQKGRLSIVGFNEDPYSLHYDNSACNQYCKVEFPIGLKQTMENLCFRVAGSCDGLVLLADDLGHYAYNFVIWNPSIRKYVTLPKPFVRFSTHGRYDGSVGLGYDAIGNDYKVVRLTRLLDQPNEGATTLVQVYSLAKGTWGMLRALPPCIVPGCLFTAPFVNGALHWLAMRWMIDRFSCFVVAFDVGNGSHREIMFPDFQQGRVLISGRLEMRLSVSGDGKSIALFVRKDAVSY
ncbi:hypothetical protein M0R45_014694 [Rubus argutus]|uniref:F-box domain-containing protein n=1 Tax=Rubus argutus TaxID=59490 RepID=A0AAW1XNM9_RUBAR